MKKYKLNRGLIFMIISVIILIITVFGATYAYYGQVLFNDLTVSNTVTKGLDYYVNYAKGTSVSNGTLTPSSTYSGGLNASVSLYKKDNTYNLYGQIYLDVSQIGSNLRTNEAFKYTVVDSSNNIVEEDSLYGTKSNSSVIIAGNIPLKTTSETYTVYIWIDETTLMNYNIENEALSATIRCEVTMKPIIYDRYKYGNSAVSFINNLYNANSTVSNNSITYNIDTSSSLIKDTDNNIRYYGANPNNYIYFNCETYPSTNCEKWRIIGIIDGKLKIMRGSSIGGYSWDTSANTTAGNSGYGINEWSQADLMKLLNPGYSGTGGSLYYNKASGTCYNGRSNATTSCNFTSSGLKNDATKNKIAEATWKTGALNSNGKRANEALASEKSTLTGSSTNDGVTRTTTWTGKVAVPSVSDFGYAVDFSKCSVAMNYYQNSECETNNWISKTFKNSYVWLLNPYSGSSSYIMYKYFTEYLSYTNASNAYSVVPTLYLANDAVIEGGSGTASDPYSLSA